MPRKVIIHYTALRSCLVNLPISMYGPLLRNEVRPQSLAIHLLKPGPSKSDSRWAYVGWSGLVSSSSLAQFSQAKSRQDGSLESVEIDPQFAAALGFAEGDVAEIGLLYDLPVAKSISAEPLTADDWEILELHAGYVEDNLLSQVRVACINQEIDVWVLGRTRVRFRVVSTDPSDHQNAVLLSTNTEVSIAPKPRHPAKGRSNDKKDKKGASDDQKKLDSEEKAPTMSPKLQPFVLRVLPRQLVVFPEGGVPSEPTVYVSPTTLGQIVNSSLPIPPESGNSYYASVRRLTPPSAAGISSTNDAANSAAPPPVPQERILRPTGSKEAASSAVVPDGPKLDERVLFRSVGGIPERHMVRGMSLGGLYSDWDLVSVQRSSIERRKHGLLETTSSLREIKITESFKTSSLAGVDGVLDQIVNFIVRSFALQGRSIAGFGSAVCGVTGILLCGAPGSGRTSVAKAAVKRLSGDPRVFARTSFLNYLVLFSTALIDHIYVDMAKLADERAATLKALFDKWIDTASWHKPSVLVLDNLDRVVNPEVEHADSTRQRQLAEHFLSSFASPRAASGVVLLATCQNQSTLHSLLSTSHIFLERVNLRAPNKDSRKDIIAQLVEKQSALSDLSLDPSQPLNYVALATETEGYSATDLRDLVSRAIHQAAIRSLSLPKTTTIRLTSADFASAQVGFTPLSLRDVKLQRSEVEWSDIGGLHEIRRVLRETLEWPTKYGAIFAKCPIRLRSGQVTRTKLRFYVHSSHLYFAKECGLNFISVKGPELLNKYIGASEKSVRELFDRATAAKPCVLFFDEFDSIAPKRGHDSTGVTDRVVNQMLTQMDGAEGLDGVYVLAATSRPDLIDAALLRPGRLDKSLLCDMPDALERAEIIGALRRKVTLAEDVNVEEFARLTENYSGADLQALVYNAHLHAVHESISAAESSRVTTASSESAQSVSFTTFGGPRSQIVLSSAEQSVQQRRIETIVSSLGKKPINKHIAGQPRRSKPIVTNEHLHQSLASTHPSISPEEKARLAFIYRSFVSDRSGDLPVPPSSAEVGSRASLG
ncbi:P-loop containing nucleoside triphosphate hydrolase protein [Cantharellus anzutake]|uniref:P-loop containing nucleoside triphosphate hydrolase protein n=1 Tax=Cantharellus anzutake TaxID=1750568 RepID=UPI00190347CC|nr:P-loop containing nucleoside triphosphate hydrolase protein [Cantharellus anzutake]KAF8331356.1 P-loop containing nucleoside triphosphate hydrolase protein [Cantharellus anzutake]